MPTKSFQATSPDLVDETAILAKIPSRNTNELLSRYEDSLRAHFPSKEEVLREAKAQTQRQRRAKGAIVTAVFVGALSGLWFVDPSLHTNEVTAGIGDRTTVTLFDGSVVTVNTNSVVKIETHLRSRQVRLVQGEALFNVAHSWRSFTVHANRTTVLDIGTVFSVRNTIDGARVTVLEGSVEVTTDSGKQLLVGEQAIESAAGQLRTVENVDSIAATAWQRGKLMFNGTSLQDAVTDMQRYRKGSITIADERAARLRLSGEYDIQGIEALISALPDTLPVIVQRDVEGSVRISARAAIAQK